MLIGPPVIRNVQLYKILAIARLLLILATSTLIGLPSYRGGGKVTDNSKFNYLWELCGVPALFPSTGQVAIVPVPLSITVSC